MSIYWRFYRLILLYFTFLCCVLNLAGYVSPWEKKKNLLFQFDASDFDFDFFLTVIRTELHLKKLRVIGKAGGFDVFSVCEIIW